MRQGKQVEISGIYILGLLYLTLFVKLVEIGQAKSNCQWLNSNDG